MQLSLLALLFLTLTPIAQSFESTKVLPQGVRSITFKNVITSPKARTDGHGKALSLAEPLAQKLTLKKIIDGERDPIKQGLLRAFVDSEKSLSYNDYLGTFTADLQANIQVFAPIFAIGVHEKLTLAVAIPYYDISTDAKLGFRPNNTSAKKFMGLLTKPNINQPEEAMTAWNKINNANAELQSKLIDNGFRSLGTWREQGFGDITIAAKQMLINPGPYAIASFYGLVLPTGRRDNPDILTDLPFGDGQLDTFFQLTSDQFLNYGFTVNQYLKYTYQAAGHRTIRLGTETDKIQVPKKEAHFKLGDKIDGGTAVLWEGRSGVGVGFGAVYFRKFADKYEVAAPVRQVVEKYSDQESLYAEGQLSYSSVAAYQRGDSAIPLAIAMNYQKQISSKNQPVNDLITININMFF